MTGKMLISQYVLEEREENRRIARACNVATYFIDNFHLYVGTSVSSKEIRAEIRYKLNPMLMYENDTRSEEEIRGDHRAHGDAWGMSGLQLNAVGPKSKREIEFSLINLKRCTSYLLGQGPKVGALRLLKEEEPSKILEDDKLINEAARIPGCRFTDWESDFVESMIHNWKGKGLSNPQRKKLHQIVCERS